MSSKYLYHATFARNLPGIARKGLLPGSGRNFPGYRHHASGRAFFTVRDGAGCWWSKLSDVAFAQNEPEDIVRELYVPVLLRVLEKTVHRLGVMSDPIGTQDCGHEEAFYIKASVIPGLLRVWDGRRWVRVDSDPETVAQGYVASAEEEANSDGSTYLDLELELPEGY